MENNKKESKIPKMNDFSRGSNIPIQQITPNMPPVKPPKPKK